MRRRSAGYRVECGLYRASRTTAPANAPSCARDEPHARVGGPSDARSAAGEFSCLNKEGGRQPIRTRRQRTVEAFSKRIRSLRGSGHFERPSIPHAACESVARRKARPGRTQGSGIGKASASANSFLRKGGVDRRRPGRTREAIRRIGEQPTPERCELPELKVRGVPAGWARAESLVAREPATRDRGSDQGRFARTVNRAGIDNRHSRQVGPRPQVAAAEANPSDSHSTSTQRKRGLKMTAILRPRPRGATHILVCRNCGVHLHADFRIVTDADSDAQIPFEDGWATSGPRSRSVAGS